MSNQKIFQKIYFNIIDTYYIQHYNRLKKLDFFNQFCVSAEVITNLFMNQLLYLD